MTKPQILVAGGLVVAALAFVAGALSAVAYLAQPFAKWQTEFTETFLPTQAESLSALRHGDSALAARYLEAVSAIALQELAEQKSKGAKVPSSARAMQAVEYLCTTAAGAASSPASVERSCATLRATGK